MSDGYICVMCLQPTLVIYLLCEEGGMLSTERLKTQLVAKQDIMYKLHVCVWKGMLR